jgi:exodeoxyribonuclease VII large subunit
MPDRVFSVTKLTTSIRNNLLSNNPKLEGVWIEGEVSGWKIYPSGHAYFTLKDASSQINAVIFYVAKSKSLDKEFKKRVVSSNGREGALNGVKIQVRGELDLNISRGQYSFKVSQVRIAGEGELNAKFEALKAQLEEEGLIKITHPEKARPLPKMPRRIGIVTSPAGAVIHDMCNVLTRRFPNIEVRLFPVKVQGDGAKEEIRQGIVYFNTLNDWKADVLIVGRGGGSMEDLWAFNEEIVARAVASSKIPVISAVGHQTDFTICDFVADVRAGTPSIAAELAVPEKAKIVAQIEDLSQRRVAALRRSGEYKAQHLDHLEGRLGSSIKNALSATQLRLRESGMRLRPSLECFVLLSEGRFTKLKGRLEPGICRSIERIDARLSRLSAKLSLLDPSNPLERGYSITIGEDGKVIRSKKDVKEGSTLKTRLGEGEVTSIVTSLV